MTDFAERVDRLLYLAHLSVDELGARLADAPDETFHALFPDYPSWRAERPGVRRRETEQAAAEQRQVPGRPQLRRQWRRRA
jgi:hypothetical protein